MKNGIVRFAALYVFNVAVLLLIGLLSAGVSVGFHALWAAVILTLAALFVKPLLTGAFRKAAAKSAADRTKTGEKVVQYVLVYLVELIIWVAVVWLSGVRASGTSPGRALGQPDQADQQQEQACRAQEDVVSGTGERLLVDEPVDLRQGLSL